MRRWHQSLISILVALVAGINGIRQFQSCIPRKYQYDSVVCICNATYCDTFNPITPLPKGKYLIVTSSREGLRFDQTTGHFQKDADPRDAGGVVLTVDRSVVHQTLAGFGGSFTDAAGINIAKLSPASENNLMSSYFSSSGLEYSVGRVPMGGCDFSTRLYTYADEETEDLSNFKLEAEDYSVKIPYILMAEKLRRGKIALIATPWSAPVWMKTNDELYGRGFLKAESQALWANYYLRFLEEYEQLGVIFWAVTTQNEPINGLIPNFKFNCMGWNATSQRDWLRDHLGPLLKSSAYRDVDILILDDQRPLIEEWVDTVLSDEKAAQYASGIGVHWYLNYLSNTDGLDAVHEKFPDYYIMGTEACEGDQFWVTEHVQLGNWQSGEKYAKDILQNLNHWYVGWIDWNLALDEGGGPNWSLNFVDAPIIVNNTIDEFYKQPMFYAMGHFSKFLPPRSKRIGSSLNIDGPADLEYGAFIRPDNGTVVILLNTGEKPIELSINDEDRGRLPLILSPKSFNSLVYW